MEKRREKRIMMKRREGSNVDGMAWKDGGRN